MSEASALSDSKPRGRFGAFGGVFTPTLLTILGVILFLRTGWVVGEVGVLGAALVVTLAFAISTATGLSLSSIVSNIRVEGGGAFSVITKTLGVELGGSIGLPLYLSQALVIVLYIFGFRTGWQWIFPDHNALLVDVAVGGVIFVIAWISARLAFRIQYAILAIIGVAVGAFWLAPVFHDAPLAGAPWSGGEGALFSGGGFWGVFAVFFPAVTGIMAGANMSGELESPSRDIPRGTLAAIGVSYGVYLVSVILLSIMATPSALQRNDTILIDLALWRPAALAGLLAATFSSALATAVGAPRILQALGRREVVPGGRWVAALSDGGEPRHALAITALIVALGVALRDLNQIASLITLFFLLTYGVINAVLLAEQWINSASFRPTFKVPRVVPIVGLAGCVGGMILIQPLFTLLAAASICVGYIWLLSRDLSGPYGEVRSGLAVLLANRISRWLDDMRQRKQHLWQAHCLIPCVEVPDPPLRDLAATLSRPHGSVTILGLQTDDDGETSSRAGPSLDDGALASCVRTLREEGIFAKETVIHPQNPLDGLETALRVMRALPIRPNVLLLPLSTMTSDEARDDRDGDESHGDDDESREDGSPSRRLAFLHAWGGDELQNLLTYAHQLNFGLCVYAPGEADDASLGLDARSQVRVWLERPGSSWTFDRDAEGFSLTVLTLYSLYRRFDVAPRFVACEDDESARDQALAYVQKLVDVERIPRTQVDVAPDLQRALEASRDARLHIFVLQALPSLDRMTRLRAAARTRCLFILTSGEAHADS